jgi:sugar (pentulose or hexulose) kinase
VGAEPLFVTVEVGTTGARAAAVDRCGTIVREVRRPYALTSLRAGWAEQDARAWASMAMTCLAELAHLVGGRRIAAIGLTGQTPTVVPVDERCAPLRAGMLYRDNRAEAEAAAMITSLGALRLHQVTGHTPAAFHVGPKILWLRTHEPEVFGRTRWFLQPRDVVLHALTGIVATDETHANATALFDLRARTWSETILHALDLEARLLPPALPPSTVVGPVQKAMAAELGLPASTPVVIGAGDSQCAAFGAGVTVPGAVSEMAGSSSCLNTVVVSPVADLRVTHYSHVVPDVFTTEVGLNTTGAAIRWAVETLGFRTYDCFAAAASEGRRRVVDAEDPATVAPVFVPHLGDGERDDPDASCGFFALSERHDRAALAYAVLEGVATAVAIEVDVLRSAGCPAEELRASGGGTRLPLLGQAKADLVGVPVAHLDVDASAVGAALLAAGSTGSGDEARSGLEAVRSRATRFVPDPAFVDAAATRKAAYRRFA